MDIWPESSPKEKKIQDFLANEFMDIILKNAKAFNKC